MVILGGWAFSYERGTPLHSTPYTLHPTHYTLHPTPYTLHPTPYTLNTTPYTPHPAPCTLQPSHVWGPIPQVARISYLLVVGAGALLHLEARDQNQALPLASADPFQLGLPRRLSGVCASPMQGCGCCSSKRFWRPSSL